MQQDARKQPSGRTSTQQAKPFPVTKRQVWDAWKRVKANQGGAGIDQQSLADFEENLADNLYKIWNRMASGSYHPKPVRRVNIPKSDGGIRPLAQVRHFIVLWKYGISPFPFSVDFFSGIWTTEIY